MTAPDNERPSRAIRPRDAATLIVIRRDLDAVRFLMGRRSARHAFMPGSLVFPGGRVDRCDHFAPAVDALDPAVAAKLLLRSRVDARRARAIALAAIRETHEETGMLVGARAPVLRSTRSAAWRSFLATGIAPELAPLRLVARAITPPGHVRRFDARFFCVWAEAIAAQAPTANEELERPSWYSFEEAKRQPLPVITSLILQSLAERMETAPDLPPDGPVPFFFMRGGEHRMELL